MTATSSSLDDRLKRLGTKAADPFSQQVIEGAGHALSCDGNPLRISFFATSMRILFEHLMDTLAPRCKVQRCAWFETETEDDRPTRRQRVTYAIQGGFTDAFVNDELKVDPEPLKKTLLAAIDALSKHIHGRETTIITEHDEQDRFAEATLDEMEAFLDAMHACREAVLLPVVEELDDAAVDTLLSETIQEVDRLASRYSLEEIYVDNVVVNDIDPHTVEFRATGSISVILQWGSNSDLRRGDGAELPESFSFWCNITLPIDNPWDLRYAETEYGVDNRDWYGERYD